jgi:hypothetical protein
VVARLLDRIRRERDAHPDKTITVVVSERFGRPNMVSLLGHPHLLSIKAHLLFEPGVVLTDVTTVRRRRRPVRTEPPQDIHAVVLCADLTRPVREALAYAESLGAPITAVHIDTDPEETVRFLAGWDAAGYEWPLEIVSSPYRGITRPLLRYLHRLRHDEAPGTLINVVIPEFIVPGRIPQILHNQTGLAIKAVLAPEPGIAVTSVPFHLAPASALQSLD